jgi:sugar O-acyltransferase (sialic acid O-acetyltransferase NeuD family)
MKKNKLVIFGIGKISDVVYSNFKNRSNLEVVAFVCDAAFIPSEKIKHGLPVVTTEEVNKLYPPSEHQAFVAVGYQGLNSLRIEKFKKMKDLGYVLANFVDPDYFDYQLSIQGENCFVMHGSVIQYGLHVGDNNFIWGGSILGHHSKIGNHNWFTSGCNIAGCVMIGDANFFSINTTVSDNINIGSGNFLGANALITKDINDNQTFIVKSTGAFGLDAKRFSKLLSY